MVAAAGEDDPPTANVLWALNFGNPSVPAARYTYWAKVPRPPEIPTVFYRRRDSRRRPAVPGGIRESQLSPQQRRRLRIRL